MSVTGELFKIQRFTRLRISVCSGWACVPWMTMAARETRLESAGRREFCWLWCEMHVFRNRRIILHPVIWCREPKLSAACCRGGFICIHTHHTGFLHKWLFIKPAFLVTHTLGGWRQAVCPFFTHKPERDVNLHEISKGCRALSQAVEPNSFFTVFFLSCCWREVLVNTYTTPWGRWGARKDFFTFFIPQIEFPVTRTHFLLQPVRNEDISQSEASLCGHPSGACAFCAVSEEPVLAP